MDAGEVERICLAQKGRLRLTIEGERICEKGGYGKGRGKKPGGGARGALEMMPHIRNGVEKSVGGTVGVIHIS